MEDIKTIKKETARLRKQISETQVKTAEIRKELESLKKENVK